MTTFQRDPVLELALGGFWVDASDDVFDTDDSTCVITRGRGGETSSAVPSSCVFSLTNRDGKYSPRNPLGPYFGQFGRNTPVRVSLREVSDGFGDAVSGGWGSTDQNPEGPSWLVLPWSTAGAGGTVQASDFNVSAGKATHSVPATNAHRRTMLATSSIRNGGVLVTATVPFTNVTGAPIEVANVILRGTSTPDYYYAWVTIETDESIKIGFKTHSGATIAAQVTVPGLTHSSSQPIRVFAMAEGQTLRAKVWQPLLTGEPYAWNLTVHDATLPNAGQVGVRTGVVTGNTNTLPVVISYDDFEVRSMRFSGEVPSWPTRWSTSFDATTEIEAAGVLRRLGQGEAPQHSVLYRGILNQTNKPVAYWPCEDAAGSTSFASALGGPVMNIQTGTPTMASSTAFVASDPLPVVNHSWWHGNVPTHATTGSYQFRFLVSVPSGGSTDGTVLAGIESTGTCRQWDICYTTGGGLRLIGWSTAGTVALDSGALGFSLDGSPQRISLELVQSGSDVNWSISAIVPGQGSGGGIGATLAGFTFGRITGVTVSTQGGQADVAMGHFSIQTAIDSLFTLGQQLAAYAGEASGDRISRTCGELGVPFSYQGTPGTSMGPQAKATPMSTIQDAVSTNLGELFEPRGLVGLEYRNRSSFYNQAARWTLNYGNGDLSPPFAPLDDDRNTRNVVTITRTGGSSATVSVDTGSMSTQDPPNGVGRYPDARTLNLARDDQLADHAGWRAHLGTVDEPRHPAINVDLMGPNASGLLDLDIGDRLDITNASAAGFYDPITQVVLGCTERLSTFRHTMAFTGGPESPWRAFVFDDAVLGRLHPDGATLASSATTTATTLPVATPAGKPLWTTDPADCPMDLTVTGEQITVTAVAGGSSPQTFTVIRSVNGVVKAHSAGEAVELTSKHVLAL